MCVVEPEIIVDCVADFVKGNVVGIPVFDRVYERETEYVVDNVLDLVKGYVVGIPV